MDGQPNQPGHGTKGIVIALEFVALYLHVQDLVQDDVGEIDDKI